MSENKAMSCKEMRDYYGISRKTFKRWVNALPESLRSLIPSTNGIMTPATVQQLKEHWGEP